MSCGLAETKALEARGQELVGVLNVASAGLVGVVAEALDQALWEGWGIKSPQHWVALRFGVSSRRAGCLVAAARGLVGLPACRAAFAAGELSEDQVAVIVAAGVEPCNDQKAAELARVATVGQLRHALTGLAKPKPRPERDEGSGSGGDDPVPEPRSYVGRSWREDGCFELRAVLGAASGAVVGKAIDAAIERLFRVRYGEGADPALRQEISAADALALVAKLALDAMDPATAAGGGRMPSERYLVNLHVDAASGTGGLHLGPALARAVIEEVGCDALVRLWLVDGAGNVNLGRTARTVDAKLRTVIEHRDGGCRVPGCPSRRGLRVHHIVHWAAGGSTDTTNLVALCPAHHRLVHRGVLRIEGNPDTATVVFIDTAGRPLGYRAPAPVLGPPDVAARQIGLDPPGWENRSGERGDWTMLAWNEPPNPQDPNHVNWN